MNDSAAVREYFNSYESYFWQWEDDGMVVAIPQAATISYKEYVGDVIEKLSPQGLPPFGSLLLAIIATNPEGSTSLDVVYKITSSALQTTDDVHLARAISFLKTLVDLPREYKEGPRRIAVLQVLFENCHNILSIKNSEAVLRTYRTGLSLTSKLPFANDVFYTDFRPLSLLDQKFPDANAILQKITAIPDPNQIEIEFEKKAGGDEPAAIDLIAQLADNEKTRPVGSLIRWFWSGLNIPVHSSLPSEQPLGGVSDLTNKGQFDKLLISEFANDDLSFLSRLANNEALYIHRETPPAHNNLQRLILIDATLKMWGTPKVMAFALMLAISRHPKTDIPCLAFVLGSEEYFSIGIDHIHDIIDALHILEGGLHPGKSLKKFLKDFASEKDKEIFLLTEKSTYVQSDVLRVLTEEPRKINYAILTDDSGNVDVYKKERKGSKHVQHLKLPLEDLWTKKNKPTLKKYDGQLKFNLDYPILLRTDRQHKGFVSTPDGQIFQCTGERSVLRLFDPADQRTHGWDLVCRDLPFKTAIFEMGIVGSGHYVLLLFAAGKREVCLLNLQTGEKQDFIFDDWKSSTQPSFIFDDGSFVHHNSGGFWSISTRGEIKKLDWFDRSKFDKRHKVLKTLESKYTSAHGVFKNINRIHINSSNELGFNVHALRLTANKMHLKLSPATDKTAKLSAKFTDNQMFAFDDGSTVEINRNGLAILRSSDSMIPAIYLPTVLDSSLGIATADEFAGNDYYYKQQTYRVVLKNMGPRSEDLPKIIQDELKNEEIVFPEWTSADLPVTLISFCPGKKAFALHQALSKAGATVEVLLPVGETAKELKTISPSAFYNKHVGRFINTILNYGA